ncbi:MAG: hypothetical protein HYY17_03285 [Planctomycetes bacterium]|nr:hypothetical protein [Planctomycetota bacterium]
MSIEEFARELMVLVGLRRRMAALWLAERREAEQLLRRRAEELRRTPGYWQNVYAFFGPGR